MWYCLAADVIVVVHLLYMAFVIVGQLAIVLGAVLRWEWIRNVWFRRLHLLAISIVAVQAILGIACPLTVWERNLRLLAGQPVGNESFVARLVHSVLFYEFEPWVFTTCYVVFALLVLGTYIWVPPRRRQ